MWSPTHAAVLCTLLSRNAIPLRARVHTFNISHGCQRAISSPKHAAVLCTLLSRNAIPLRARVHTLFPRISAQGGGGGGLFCFHLNKLENLFI